MQRRTRSLARQIGDAETRHLCYVSRSDRDEVPMSDGYAIEGLPVNAPDRRAGRAQL
jgi:hypothetical protein